MIVMKFGGSSIESAEAIERVAAIVASSLPKAPIVVVSALGKTTDELLRIAEQTAEDRRDALSRLRSRHLAVAPRLAHWQVKQHFEELEAILDSATPLTPARLDIIASFGERLSSVIVTAALVLRGVPAHH